MVGLNLHSGIDEGIDCINRGIGPMNVGWGCINNIDQLILPYQFESLNEEIKKPNLLNWFSREEFVYSSFSLSLVIDYVIPMKDNSLEPPTFS